MRPDRGTGSGISERFSFLELLSQERVRYRIAESWCVWGGASSKGSAELTGSESVDWGPGQTLNLSLEPISLLRSHFNSFFFQLQLK